jgi:probable lipoprotein NlpC
MGKQIFLCVAACFLLFSFHSNGQTANEASYNSSVKSNTPGQPEFIRDLFMNTHNKTNETKNSIEVKKNDDNIPVAPATMASETNEALLKSDVVETNDVAATTIKRPDTTQNTNKEEFNEADKAAADETLLAAEEEIHTAITKYAQMISIEPTEITNFSLYQFIDGWYGIQYKWGGTDTTGIDCSAFSQKLYGQVFGVEILRTARQQHRHCEHIRYSEDANEGDLVFFRIHRFRISHVGIYLANGYFVHASSTHGVTISSLNDKYWRRRYAGCGRISKEVKSMTESDFTP